MVGIFDVPTLMLHGATTIRVCRFGASGYSLPRSFVAPANGMTAASPSRKSTSTPARAAFSLAMRTNERLTSSPVIR